MSDSLGIYVLPKGQGDMGNFSIALPQKNNILSLSWYKLQSSR